MGTFWKGGAKSPSLFFTILIQQADTLVFKNNDAFLVKGAEGLFESFFTDTETFPDVFRWGFIIQLQTPAVPLEGEEDQITQGHDFLAAGFIEPEIDFPVRPHGLDKSFEFLPDFERAGQMVVTKSPRVLILDNRTVSKRGRVRHQEVNRLALCIRGRGLAEMLF